MKRQEMLVEMMALERLEGCKLLESRMLDQSRSQEDTIQELTARLEVEQRKTGIAAAELEEAAAAGAKMIGPSPVRKAAKKLVASLNGKKSK